MWTLPKYRAGDWVIVRSKEEIFATLDQSGALDGMPFMPEMLAFCGRRMRVVAIAHKTCDPAHRTGGRRIDRAVHLEASRCSGAAHGGCQAECNLFWKDAWIKPAPANTADQEPRREMSASPPPLSELAQLPTQRGDRYTCQATELNNASVQLPWWNPRQYLLDFTTGNHSFKQVVRVLTLSWARQLLRIPIGYRIWWSIYNALHRFFFGREAPIIEGQVPPGQKTPGDSLNVQPGELVRVKPVREIVLTLDRNCKNRGMWFDVEQTAFCEQEFKVHKRITRIINERTGEMMEMKNPCITLEGVLCSGLHSSERLLCPRAITPYFREVWLERAASEKAAEPK